MINAWEDTYALQYSYHSQKNRARRLKRRARDRERRLQKARLKPLTDEDALLGEMARSRATARRKLMKIRLEFGFRWDGGAIGGCRQYRRRAFRHMGLISDETPILLLFVSKTRRGHAPADRGQQSRSDKNGLKTFSARLGLCGNQPDYARRLACRSRYELAFLGSSAVRDPGVRGAIAECSGGIPGQ